MSTLVSKNVQIGADGTASNNFTIYQPASPDGTLRIGNGNTGTTSAQVVLTSAGNVGIGTSSPDIFGRGHTRLLGISTASGNSMIQLNGASGAFGGLELGAGNTRYATISAPSTDLTITTNAAIPFVLGTNNTERMRINAGAPILCLAGGNTSATGTGIAFPATQSASSDANTLDDYEEGTFTPVVADATTGGNVSSSVFSGTYTKVGRLVTVQISLSNIDTTGLTSGNTLYCRGLPFVTLNGSTDSYSAVFADRINFTNYIVAGTVVNSSYIRFFDIIDSTPDENLKVSAITASTGSDIYFSITYFV